VPDTLIPVARTWMDEREADAARRAILSGWVTQGPEVAAFEGEFAEALGAGHACAVSSCTTAIHIALAALGVGAGDEVITVSHSFNATGSAVLSTGATPMFIDIEPDTYNMDAGLIEAAITPRTRAICPVDLFGLPADMPAIADIAERHGSGRVRTTVEQKMVILDVAPDQVDSIVAELEANDLRVKPSTFRRQTMACTGIEYCKLAIVETKQRAMDLIDELEKRLPDFDQPLSVNVNGCPNACARIQVADIGLKGQLVVDENGDQVEGFQIHLGGQVGASFGRKVRGLKTTSAGLTDYVERVVRKYDEQRHDGESFAEWVQRADEADLK
jgi:hypothetical protein